MGLLTHCLSFLSTFGRSSFMFGKQLWIPTFSLLYTWKAVLSILTETLLPQVPKRFAKSRNFSSKSGKIQRRKIFGKVRFFQIVPLKTYNAVLKKSVENVNQISGKIKMCLFARKCYISPQEGSFHKTKNFLRKASINSKDLYQGTGARKNCHCKMVFFFELSKWYFHPYLWNERKSSSTTYGFYIY